MKAYIVRISIIVFCALGTLTSVFALEPSCNDLLSSLSTEVQSSIKELAKLRFDLDQRLVRGELDVVTRSLQDQYIKKEAEVLAATRLNRESLVQKLKKEISVLQNESIEQASKRVQTKAVEREKLEHSDIKVSQFGKLRTARTGQPVSVLPDGKLLIAGGVDSQGRPMGQIEIFDPATQKSSLIGVLVQPRSNQGQTVLSDGRVIVIGGSGASRALLSIEVIDPKTGQSKTLGKLKKARFGHTVTELPNGDILIVGGSDRGRFLISSFEVLDPHTGKTKLLGNLEDGRLGHTQVLLDDGRILVFGGLQMQYSTLDGDEIEAIDLKTGETKIVGRLKEKRFGHAQTLLPNGTILTSGGYGDGAQRSSIEIFNPKDGASKIIGHLEIARDQHSQILLPNGKILVIGGTGNAGDLSEIEELDPETGYSEVIHSLKMPRSGHVQVTLTNGQILIIGGLSNGIQLDSIEAITPRIDE